MAKSNGTKSAAAAFQQLWLEQLHAARRDGDYPLTIAALARRCDVGEPQMVKAVTAPGAKTLVAALAKIPAAPLVLAADRSLLASCPLSWDYWAQVAAANRQAKHAPNLAEVKKFLTDAKIPSDLKAECTRLLTAWVASGALPESLQPLVQLPLNTAQMAARLVDVIGSQRDASADSYPVPEERLRQLGDLEGISDKEWKAIQKEESFLRQVTSCQPARGAKKPRFALTADIDAPAAAVVRRAMVDALLAAGPSTAVTADDAAKTLFKEKTRQTAFAARLEELSDETAREAGCSWLTYEGQRLYFHAASVRPTGPSVGTQTAAQPVASPTTVASPTVPSPTRPAAVEAGRRFSHDFAEAFRLVDAQAGGRNFVKVFALRQALPAYTREEFDRGLRDLRLAGQYTMDSAQGGYVQLTAEELEAGIQEGSSKLVYVTRKRQ